MEKKILGHCNFSTLSTELLSIADSIDKQFIRTFMSTVEWSYLGALFTWSSD